MPKPLNYSYLPNIVTTKLSRPIFSDNLPRSILDALWTVHTLVGLKKTWGKIQMNIS
jgi:hypothetical protein